ncbi:hypothetical protein P7H62_03660 [Vagococcus carniphilus]|uniref:hypothetical protein n=1 Tax=Vagococcus carniphilus TaxID=218144 RepID=UPI00288E2CE6|nr:hypothetical protein [Vagococcus carniphilus]MDT2830266.1 hypothetical protein [Vagococcus carniphilus]MDT2838698.1 hypothetical protein [Vagococcus carniphilus]MDT2853536.1 hypothetical protein [Vagococcus carniphilus]
MSNKLLIDKKQRNLLLFSNFIKNNELEIFELLENNLSISRKLAGDNNLDFIIDSNLSTWLNFSRKEWKAHDKNPFLISDSESIQNCELCNSPLKWRYEVYNEFSNKKISIGGECVKQFKQLKGLGKLVTGEEEYKRYNHLIKIYPMALDVLVKNTDMLDRIKIVIPDFYKESFKKTEKEITKILKTYIKKNVKINHNMIEKAFKKYSTELKSINDFIENNEGNRNYLSREIVDAIERNQKSDMSLIISDVEGNNGVISSLLSPKIKVSNYLKLYEKDINIKFNKSNVNISEINHAVYILKVKSNKTSYNFKVSSEYLLAKLYARVSFSFPEKFKGDIDVFEINEAQTRERLHMDGQQYILSDISKDLKDINYRKIISLYDKDLTNEEYNVAYQKVTRILSNLLVVSKVNTKDLEIYLNKEVEKIGKSLLFELEPNLQDSSFKMSEPNFYNYIVNRIDG